MPIQILHVHMRDEKELVRKGKRTLEMERENENYGMVPASEKAILRLKRKIMKSEGSTNNIFL